MHKSEFDKALDEPGFPKLTALIEQTVPGIELIDSGPWGGATAMAKDIVEAAADDPVNPKHYKDMGQFSAVHIIPKWNLGFEVGNALKYIQRAGSKPGESEVRDLKKAVWYLNRKIHLLDNSEPDPAAND